MTPNKAAQAFLEALFDPLRQAGMVALALQTDVVNLGKEVDRRSADSELLARKRAAKTKVDVLVQDMLLLPLFNLADKLDLALDAEEQSRFVSRFPPIGGGTRAVIIDPIDGTLEYIQQQESYSICAGLRLEGEIVASLVFFPARNRLYYSDMQEAHVVEGFLENGLKYKKQLTRRGTAPKRLFVNKRVPHGLMLKLQELNIEVRDDEENGIGAPDAILGCLEGNSICYLSYTRQIRDILLGAIIGKMAYGYAIDWHGGQIKWPDASRLDRGVFGCWELPPGLLDALKVFAE